MILEFLSPEMFCFFKIPTWFLRFRFQKCIFQLDFIKCTVLHRKPKSSGISMFFIDFK